MVTRLAWMCERVGRPSSSLHRDTRRRPPLARTDGDIEAMAMYAGQSVGAIDAVEPAAAIVERFAAALGSVRSSV
jgi:hypothetical protein